MALKAKEKEDQTATTNEETTTSSQEETTSKDTNVATRPAAGALAPAIKNSMFISNAAFLDAVVDAEYGTFVSVVASNGTHMVSGTDTDLGKVIRFQGILVKNSKKIVPGSSDEEAKEYFAVSEDGEFVKDGRSLEEALQDAKDAGYEKASIKDYVDVICLIVECDNADFIGETVTLQLAPSSQYSWRPLAGRCKMEAAKGKLISQPVLGDEESFGSAVIFTSTAKPTSFKGNNFTKFIFSI